MSPEELERIILKGDRKEIIKQYVSEYHSNCVGKIYTPTPVEVWFPENNLDRTKSDKKKPKA